jgi:RimJ/RimL family protein N-acetyltransferase
MAYGSELVIAMSEWLLGQSGVTRVSAHAALDKWPSRRALERAGFRLQSADPHHAKYTLDPGVSRGPAAHRSRQVELDR